MRLLFRVWRSIIVGWIDTSCSMEHCCLRGIMTRVTYGFLFFFFLATHFKLAFVVTTRYYFFSLKTIFIRVQDVLHLPRHISMKGHTANLECSSILLRWKWRKSRAGSFIAFQTFPWFNIIYWLNYHYYYHNRKIHCCNRDKKRIFQISFPLETWKFLLALASWRHSTNV